MNNTIILLHGERMLSHAEYKNFTSGDAVMGIDAMPEEIQRWPIEQAEEAREELKKYRCRYDKGISAWQIEEYALEFCECDEFGEFLNGAEFEMAGEMKKAEKKNK